MVLISRTIRDIDEDLYRKLRAACIEKDIKIGDGLNEALRDWLRKEGKIK